MKYFYKISLLIVTLSLVIACDMKTSDNTEVQQSDSTLEFASTLEKNVNDLLVSDKITVSIIDTTVKNDAENPRYIINIKDKNQSEYTIFANNNFEMVSYTKNFSDSDFDNILDELETYITIFKVYNDSDNNEDYNEFINQFEISATDYFTNSKGPFLTYDSETTDLSFTITYLLVGITAEDTSL